MYDIFIGKPEKHRPVSARSLLKDSDSFSYKNKKTKKRKELFPGV